ncbi:hypothetical protein FIBSPDRAFT_882036 [Athelia psychrophila]|uniref:Uncharacterized protein n=1 Tax=Athelia psychrophila TaxID=1759441 RepID=A0A166W1F5_9AGAM|nr:hypothetical protein FIBSPDRAFT_882036 [Fibularhizoctonia sp. CBS 109695]
MPDCRSAGVPDFPFQMFPAQTLSPKTAALWPHPEPSIARGRAILMLVVPAAVEESRAARQQRQQSRVRDRGGIFVPPENNALLDFLLARTVTGESPSKANARRESLRPRAGSSPVREDGKGKGRAVGSEDEEGADAATGMSNPTRRKSGRVVGPGHGQPVPGPSRGAAEDGARSEQARTKGEENDKYAPSAPKPKPRSRAAKGKTKVKEAPKNVSKSDEDDDELAQEATQSQPKPKSKPKPKARATKAKKLPPADETGDDEPAIEKPKPKPRSSKAKGKKPPEPAIPDDPDPDPELDTVEVKAQPTKSRKAPKANVANGPEPADEAEVAKPVAKKRGRPPKIKASTADNTAHTQDEVAATPLKVALPKLATRQSPAKRARDADTDDEDLSNYLPAARKRAKTTAIPEAKAKAAPKRAKTKAIVVHPDSPKPAPTRKAPPRKKQPQPGALVDPYESDGSAVVLAVKKKPGKVRAATGPSRQDPPSEPVPKIPECPTAAAIKLPPPKQRKEATLGHGSDEDTALGAKVSKSKVAQKTAKSSRAHAKAAPDESEDEGDGEAGGAKASKPKPSQPVKKSVRAPPPAELADEADTEDVATTSKPKAPAIVAKASRPRMKATIAESEEAFDEVDSAQQQSTSKPQPKPRKHATKASIRESEEQEPQQAPAKLTTKKGSTKGSVKRAREKDESAVTVNEPGPARKKAKTTATVELQSDEETLVAQAPPKSSKPDRPIGSTRSLKVKTQTANDPQKLAAELDTHKTKRLPPEIKERINAKPSALLPPPESDDDPIDFLS